MPILRVQNEDGSWVELPALIGPKGDRGDPGPTGEAGKTPEKGVDYFTESEKQEMVQAVIDALPMAEGVGF